MLSSPVASSVRSCRAALERLREIRPQIVRIFQPDVQPDGLRRDAEIPERVDLALLLEAGRRRERQALVPAPADPELEQRERVAEAADGGLVAVELEAEQPGPALERGHSGSTVTEERMAHPPDARMPGQP